MSDRFFPPTTRLAQATLVACLTATLIPTAPVRADHGAGGPVHSNLQIHVLDPADPSILTYSFGDWAGPWWVADASPPGADKVPLIVVAFETTVPSGETPMRQAHFAVLVMTETGQVQILQNEAVGPADSEIQFVEILRPGVLITGLDVYQGSDPNSLTVHHYTWDAVGLRFDPDPPDTTAALPVRSPAADQLKFGAGGVFTDIDITTNASVRSASRFVLVGQDTPPSLSVEAEPRGGLYTTTVAVVPFATDPAAAIRFTLTSDGTPPPDPDAGSPLFGSDGPDPGTDPDPIHLLPRTTSSTIWRLKLKAFSGPLSSEVVEETYVVAASLFADSDHDGLPDIWEAANGFDPLRSDRNRDTDGDGCSDFDERRLGSLENDPGSVCVETRQVRLSGSVNRPDAIAVSGATVETISPGGLDLVSDPNRIHAVTDPNGAFTGARTLGESHVILHAVDPNEPQVVLHRFVPDTRWALPPRRFGDPGFFSDPNVLSDLNRLLDPNTWFDQYKANLQYDIQIAGLGVDGRSSAVLQIVENEVEALLPGLVRDHIGFPVEIDEDNAPPGDFPGPGDIDLDGDRELDADRNDPPLEVFPGAGDTDLDGDLAFDGFVLELGRQGAGLTGRRLELLEEFGEPVSLLVATVEDPNVSTYAGWFDLAEDVVRAVPDCAGFFGTTDDVLTDLLDGRTLDPNGIGGCIDALPASFAAGAAASGSASLLPADLRGLVAAVRAAARAMAAIYGRVLLRGESGFYERGDALATGLLYRAIVARLVEARAGDPNALSDIVLGAEEGARAVQEARTLAGAGRPDALSHLLQGVRVLAAALDAADGDPGGLANLNARMNGLVYRIDRLAGDPNGLLALEQAADDFLQPDTDPPVVAIFPSGTLFTGPLVVTLLSDEPATIHYTLDGSDPAPGGASTFTAANEAAVAINADTTLSWMASDVPWLNLSGISRATYLRDADADAVADINDNCPPTYNPGQENFDGDPQGDACDPDDDNDLVADAADCRPMDNSLWAAPDELPITLIFTNVTNLEWTSLALAAGPATFYDLIRGLASDLRSAGPGHQFDAAVCRLDNGPAPAMTDMELPGPGGIFYYLVRGENACGTGLYGRGTDGAEEVSLACP
ncbi:MAG: chitobiase/beta-hexosaminidase C-terminal domain-containing protein [Candidatus Polarisedimenticolia bacterium]